MVADPGAAGSIKNFRDAARLGRDVLSTRTLVALAYACDLDLNRYVVPATADEIAS